MLIQCLLCIYIQAFILKKTNTIPQGMPFHSDMSVVLHIYLSEQFFLSISQRILVSSFTCKLIASELIEVGKYCTIKSCFAYK